MADSTSVTAPSRTPGRRANSRSCVSERWICSLLRADVEQRQRVVERSKGLAHRVDVSAVGSPAVRTLKVALFSAETVDTGSRRSAAAPDFKRRVDAHRRPRQEFRAASPPERVHPSRDLSACRQHRRCRTAHQRRALVVDHHHARAPSEAPDRGRERRPAEDRDPERPVEGDRRSSSRQARLSGSKLARFRGASREGPGRAVRTSDADRRRVGGISRWLESDAPVTPGTASRRRAPRQKLNAARPHFVGSPLSEVSTLNVSRAPCGSKPAGTACAFRAGQARCPGARRP